MNVLSLFDGMSCGRIALDKAGIKIDKYYASEIDKYAIQVAKANYPDTIHLGDVQKIQAKGGELIVPFNGEFYHTDSIDLLIGGSPCQDLSIASANRIGLQGERSGLFFEYVRLLKELKPTYFLLENVRMSKECELIITEMLGVEPVAINSNLVSAHNRHRLYWTNIPFTVPTDKGIILTGILEDGVVDRDKSHCIDANYFKGGNLKSYFEKHRRQLVFTDHTYTEYRKLTPLECERLQTVPEGYTNHVSNTQRYRMLGNGWTVDVVSHIFKYIQEFGDQTFTKSFFDEEMFDHDFNDIAIMHENVS